MAVIITATTHEAGARFADTFRDAVFQTLSILTTTGYASTDFELWAPLPLIVLLCLMVLGGMSGSTGGGIKSLRALLAVSSLRTTLHRLIHPHAVRPVKYGGAVVSESVLSGIWSFLTAYLLIALIGTAVVAAYGYDLLTAISAGLTSSGSPAMSCFSWFASSTSCSRSASAMRWSASLFSVRRRVARVYCSVTTRLISASILSAVASE